MPKGIDKKLDDAWSKAVKERDGWKCCYCGTDKNLNSHHIYSRSKKSTRWELDNGITLCVSHHTFNSGFSAHKTPLEFIEWLTDLKGQDFIDGLRLKANTPQKFFIQEKRDLLEYLNSCSE